jgi:erythromycin esterase-like protein
MDNLINYIKKNANVLTGAPGDYDSLIDMARNANYVLIGEATHGTEEFYKIRADITRRLITELDFDAVTIEGDWPDAYNVNRYVTGHKNNDIAEIALSTFERFPTWMWQNTQVLAFIKWLREHNHSHNNKNSVGFYGLDLYSISTSIYEVIKYLEKIDTTAAHIARKRYNCLYDFLDKPQMYSYATKIQLIESCEDKIVQQLEDMRAKAFDYIKKDGFVGEDEYFYAEQNAKLVKNAEEYYRSLYNAESSSWNLRDSHMAETLDDLSAYITSRKQKPAKLVVWAHNSHLGDARATEMSKRGELNLGQLARQKYPNKTLLIGFSTYAGSVTAASDWEAPPENKILRPALKGSHPEIFHRSGLENFILDLHNLNEDAAYLNNPLLQRFVGVVYHPATERMSHYYHSVLPKQFDAIIHIDKTTALEPLKSTQHWHRGELEETYPWGL